MKVLKKLLLFNMIIVLLVITLISSGTINNINVKAEDYETVNSNVDGAYRAMAVLEGNTNTLIYGKDENKKLAIASTTKIVTAIVAIENVLDLDEVVNVNDKAVGIEGTSIYLKKGEKLTVRELLYGLILASGNDAAMALALHVSETESDFAAKMNELAKSLGLNNTNFKNSHGLDEKDHYTTAYDLAVLTSYALKNNDFKEIVSTKHKQITGHPLSGERYLRNKNKLTFTQENNIGVKTGFTDDAGRCLVNAVEDKGMQIITVVLNSGPMFEEARRLTTLAFRDYEIKDFVMPYNYVGTIDVDNGDKNLVNIISIKGFKLPVKINQAEEYKVVYDMPETLTAPISKDDAIGNVKVYYKDELLYEESLYPMEDIKNIDIKYMLKEIIEKWF